MMGLRVCVGWTVAALTLALVAGCGATVTLADESGPGGEGPGGSAPAPCTDPPPSDVTLRVEGPATIIGDRLHLTGSVDGTDGYFVPRLDQGALWFSGGPVDLQGPARWVPFFDDMGTRVRGGEGAEPLVAELLDTSQPEAPKVLVTRRSAARFLGPTAGRSRCTRGGCCSAGSKTPEGRCSW